MKTRITALCLLFVQAFVGASLFAQNDTDTFFTIWFKNGTSRNFYSGDINSITYSEIDLDGNIHDDYVVQEIDVAGEVERYLLADIEEVSFEKVNLAFDVKAYLAEWEKVTSDVDRLLEGFQIDDDFDFKQFETIVPEIKKIPEVAKVSIGDSYLLVTLNNGTKLNWELAPNYTVELEPNDDDVETQNLSYNISPGNKNHEPIAGRKTVWVCNALANDPNFKEQTTRVINWLQYGLPTNKFDCFTYRTTDKWNDEAANNCDILFFHGHGNYLPEEKSHYITIGRADDNTFLGNLEDPESELVITKYLDPDGHGVKKEEQNAIGWYCITEKYLEKKLKPHKGKIVLMAACNTLAGNNKFGNVFLDKGASYYLGHPDVSYFAAFSAASFLNCLSLDYTISEAYERASKPQYISGEIKVLKIERSYWPWNLVDHYKDGIPKKKVDDKKKLLERIAKDNLTILPSKSATADNHCLMHYGIYTLKPEYCTIGEEFANLGVQINYFDNLKSMYDNYEIGVLYSTNPDPKFSNSKKMRIVAGEGKIYETTNKLEFEKEYYYRAYAILNGEEFLDDSIYNFYTKDVKFRKQLKDLYDGLDGQNWKHKENWFEDKVSVGNWEGIDYDYSGGTYSISIYNNVLKGKVNLSDCDKISALHLNGAEGSDISELKLSKCKNLKHISVRSSALNLAISDCPEFASYWYQLPENTVSAYIGNCPKITSITCSWDNKLQALTVESCNALQSIDCNGKQDLSILQIKDCFNMKSIDCSNCNLYTITGLDKCCLLESLSCTNNHINKLNINSVCLRELYCEKNPIDQTFESIPNFNNLGIWNRSYDKKYEYTQLKDENQGGKEWKLIGRIPAEELGSMESPYLYYKYRFDDRHGFYHKGEPTSIETYLKYRFEY